MSTISRVIDELENIKSIYGDVPVSLDMGTGYFPMEIKITPVGAVREDDMFAVSECPDEFICVFEEK